MKVLQVHNTYRQYGGEDVVVSMEFELLKSSDIEIEQLFFDNEKLNIIDLFYNKYSYAEIESRINKNRPDVIHVHNLFYKASISVLQCAYDNKIPVVMTMHNYRLICPNGLLLRNQKPCNDCVNKAFPIDAVKHKCFQNSTTKTLALAMSLSYNKKRNHWNNLVSRFVVLTPFAKHTFLNSSLNLDEKRIVIKPNSVDDFEPSLDTERSDYVYIGRLSNEKGVQVAIDAFNKMPSNRLHIIGTGPLEKSLKDQANENIIFHGTRDKAFIKNKLKESKALIFPSICHEGLPNTILEAFSSSTPVIASDIDNINTIVEHNLTGMHFETGDSNNLKDVVTKFSESNTSNMNKNARENYLLHYTHKKNILSLLKIYEEVIESYVKS